MLVLLILRLHTTFQDPYEAENLAEVYRIELVTALGALLVNLFVIIYAYTGDRFSPHTTMLRTVLIIDILTNVGHICEAFSSLFGGTLAFCLVKNVQNTA